MKHTGSHNDDVVSLPKVVLALLYAMIPFLYAFRASVAISKRRNKEALLADIDSNIAELHAMLAAFRGRYEPTPAEAASNRAPAIQRPDSIPAHLKTTRRTTRRLASSPSPSWGGPGWGATPHDKPQSHAPPS